MTRRLWEECSALPFDLIMVKQNNWVPKPDLSRWVEDEDDVRAFLFLMLPRTNRILNEALERKASINVDFLNRWVGNSWAELVNEGVFVQTNGRWRYCARGSSNDVLR